jgi:hypothetical protein
VKDDTGRGFISASGGQQLPTVQPPKNCKQIIKIRRQTQSPKFNYFNAAVVFIGNFFLFIYLLFKIYIDASILSYRISSYVSG